MGILTRFSSGFDRLLQVLVVVAAVLMFFIVAGVTIDVTGRFFFGLPILWMSELVSYCPLFIAFLNSAWLLKNERHVKMDVLYNQLSPKYQLMLDIVTSCLATIVFFVVTWYTGLAAWNSIVRAMGINDVWFAVIMLLNIEMGMTLPPFGLALFVMKGVAPPDTTMADCYRAACLSLAVI